MKAYYNTQAALISTPLVSNRLLVSVIYLLNIILLLIFQKAL
jgi:hypothetical protein